jgi:sugar lactone lactonase YvrE
MKDLSDIIAGDLERLATGFKFTEGPLWHPAGYWIFVCTRSNCIYKLVSGREPEIIRRNSGHACGTTFDLNGRLIMCESDSRRISRLEQDGTVTTIIDSFEGKRLSAPNDIVCQSNGAIYFSDPEGDRALGERELDSSSVFRVKSGTAERLPCEVEFPNGMAFSPDESIYYLINSRGDGKGIRAFDVEPDGSLRNGRMFIEMPRAGGMKVDVEGFVYCTAGAEGIWIIDPTGKKVGVLAVPEHPSNCAFGGIDYKTLLITARTSVYSVQLKVKGCEPPGAAKLKT